MWLSLAGFPDPHLGAASQSGRIFLSVRGSGRSGFSRPAACKQELRVKPGASGLGLWNVAGEGGLGWGIVSEGSREACRGKEGSLGEVKEFEEARCLYP